MSPPRDPSAAVRRLLREDAALRRWVRAFAPARVDAADVAQDAWLAALQHDLDPIEEPLGGWLRVAARRLALRRGWREGRRVAVESRAARAEARDESGDPALQREAAERLLEHLEEPYRAVLRARFLDDLSIDEIARELGRRPATVRSQLHRGLGRLRARLAPRRERRGAWLAWLLPRRRLAFAGLALGLAVALVELPGPSGGRAEGRAAAPAARSADSGPLLSARAPAARAALGSEPLDAPDAAPVLEVHVRDADGRAVAGATVNVTTPAGLEPRATSDATGLARVPVHAGDRGAFGLPATADRVTLRATFAGHAGSRDLHVDPGRSTVELVLGGPALTLGGSVRDAGGRPAAGALVAVLQGPSFVAPSTPGPFATPPRVTTRTDGEGRFLLTGLARTPGLVRVWAAGLAERRASFVPADSGRLDLELALARGAAVHGLLRDREGRPLAGAEVFAEPADRLTEWGLDPDALDAERLDLVRTTRSDADGAFRLTGLLPGPRTIWARHGEDVARLRVVLGADDELAWNPEWLPREALQLRLRGAPAGALVRLSSGPPEAQWLRVRVPGRDGELRVTDVPEGAIFAEVLDARGVELLARAGPLRPGPQVHEFLVSSAADRQGRLRGVLLAADGTPAASAERKRYDPWSHNQVALAIDPATGAFGARFPPGPFVLACVVEQRGLPLGTFELDAGQTLDLGRIVLPRTGRLVLLPGAAPVLEGTPATFRLSARYGQSLFRELLRGPWPPPVSLELFPGPHWIEVMDAGGEVLQRASAEVRADAEAWVDLP